MKEKEKIEPGIIFAPYICVESTDGPSEVYKKFMEKYNKDHDCCPECGNNQCMTTLVGYPFHTDDPESYKDKNACTCMKCGDNHIYHDRVPKRIKL